MIYMRMMNNALFGFISMPSGVPEMDEHGEPYDIFEHNHLDHSLPPAIVLPSIAVESELIMPHKAPVLFPGPRSSFADDLAGGAQDWDALVELVDVIMTRLRRFRISVNALKSSFGKSQVDFLGHTISEMGLAAKPRHIKAFKDLPFPTSLKTMQSFLGCLNFYSRFIDLFAQRSGNGS